MKFFNTGLWVAGSAALVVVLAACVQLGASEREDVAAAPPAKPVQDAVARLKGDFIQCNTPRPEICYEIYQPVCAVRDNGVRCITTPCPATEQASYSNDCQACADPAVIGFVKGGRCEDTQQ
ncbi:MAG: hypothetical protein R3E89_01400 [Thiolinea sp.]